MQRVIGQYGQLSPLGWAKKSQAKKIFAAGMLVLASASFALPSIAGACENEKGEKHSDCQHGKDGKCAHCKKKCADGKCKHEHGAKSAEGASAEPKKD